MFRSFWSVLFLFFVFFACTTTIRKVKDPVFAVPLDSVAQGLYRHVVSQHVNFNGLEVTTNGKVSDLLEIQIFNGRQLPEADSQLETLGRVISVGVRAALRDTGEYDTYRVVFVKVDSGRVVTKKSWRAFIYKL
jgi:hypothetical protein